MNAMLENRLLKFWRKFLENRLHETKWTHLKEGGYITYRTNGHVRAYKSHILTMPIQVYKRGSMLQLILKNQYM